MCLKRPAKDITAKLQGTKRLVSQGRAPAKSKTPSQLDEPQPSNNNCSVQQIHLCFDFIRSGGASTIFASSCTVIQLQGGWIK
uniref:Uncharacterized protein n=1 Tax=Rhizophora mucronata TaxID=61149 RepID=A0A2P2KP24_RHIMU